MLEQTQDLFETIQPHCPVVGSDKRHEESSRYPFMDYDDLTDIDSNVIGRHYYPSLCVFTADTIIYRSSIHG